MAITPLPTPPQRSDPINFSARADAFMLALPPFAIEANALATDVNAKQTAAASSATSATASATSATASASSASASAASATASAAAAVTSANNAEASNVAASKLNLGAKSSAPTLDNQGAALLVGAVYYDTTLAKWRVWDGSVWTDGISAVAGVSSINGSAGALALKTINGQSLLAAGNLVFPTPAEVSMGIKRAPMVGGTMTSPNGYYAFMADAAYVLPDFTGADTFGIASLSNSPAVPSTFQTSDGWTLTPSLAANTLKMVSPTSSGTPHGTWASTLQTPPLLGSSASASSTQVVGTAQLSSTLIVVLFRDSSGDRYVIAFNPSTGVFGTTVAIPSSTASIADSHIYAASATSFVVGFPSTSGTLAVIAGSISGLVITLGTAATDSGVIYGKLVQLSPSLYVHCSEGTGAVRALSVSGNTVSIGTSASPAAGDRGLVARISATTFLLVNYTTASLAILFATVGSISGNTITFSSLVTQTTDDINQLLFLSPLADGGPFIFCASSSTSGVFHGITVSGTTPTIGAVNTVANTKPALLRPRTYIFPPATDTTQNLLVYSPTQLLVAIPTGVVAISISGTTLTVGSVLSSATVGRLVKDAATGSNAYLVTSTTITKLEVSGTTITSSYQLASTAVVLASDTLNDKAANYSSTWYAWTLPTMSCAITSDKWLGFSGGIFNFYGPIS